MAKILIFQDVFCESEYLLVLERGELEPAEELVVRTGLVGGRLELPLEPFLRRPEFPPRPARACRNKIGQESDD